MNSLTVALILIGLVLVAVVARCHQQARLALVAEANKPTAALPSWWLPTMLLVLLALPTLLYGQLGRYGDWHRGVADVHTDYLLQAAINKSRLEVTEQPQNQQVLLQLAKDHAAGGQYDDALKVLQQLRSQHGETAPWLGLTAKYRYYRDGRVLGNEAKQALAAALQLDSSDVTTLEFMATYAYRQQDYKTAIEHWQQLLDSGNGGAYRRTIEGAITRAQAKLDRTQ